MIMSGSSNLNATVLPGVIVGTIVLLILPVINYITCYDFDSDTSCSGAPENIDQLVSRQSIAWFVASGITIFLAFVQYKRDSSQGSVIAEVGILPVCLLGLWFIGLPICVWQFGLWFNLGPTFEVEDLENCSCVATLQVTSFIIPFILYALGCFLGIFWCLRKDSSKNLSAKAAPPPLQPEKNEQAHNTWYFPLIKH